MSAFEEITPRSIHTPGEDFPGGVADGSGASRTAAENFAVAGMYRPDATGVSDWDRLHQDPALLARVNAFVRTGVMPETASVEMPRQ